MWREKRSSLLFSTSGERKFCSQSNVIKRLEEEKKMSLLTADIFILIKGDTRGDNDEMKQKRSKKNLRMVSERHLWSGLSFALAHTGSLDRRICYIKRELFGLFEIRCL